MLKDRVTCCAAASKVRFTPRLEIAYRDAGKIAIGNLELIELVRNGDASLDHTMYIQESFKALISSPQESLQI